MKIAKACRTLLVGGFLMGLAGLLGASCGSDPPVDNGPGDDCTFGGEKCQRGCSDDFGCVECLTAADCGNNDSPFCVLGRCEACEDSEDCGAGQACYPRNFTCQTACADDADCDGEEPLCDTVTGACVGCIDSGDCPAEDPICHPVTQQCGDCATSLDCPATDPVCDQQSGNCEECLVDSDCGAGEACGGDHECHFSCTLDTDCNDADKPHCDSDSGNCVECLANIDCPDPAPVCKDDKHCVQCVVDADCGADPTRPVCNGDECVQCNGDADCPDPMFPSCKGHLCEAQ